MVAVALELEDAVDEVLEHARAGHGAVLGHVTDEDRRHAVLLGGAQKPRRRLADLRHRARRGAQRGRGERLHRVDHADVRPLVLDRGAHGLQLRLGEDLDSVARRRDGPRAGLTCATDSSPLTSRPACRAQIALSARAAASTCRRRARRRRARATPGTMPPPSTRSSSGTPLEIRVFSSASTSPSRCSGFAAAEAFGSVSRPSAPRRAFRRRYTPGSGRTTGPWSCRTRCRRTERRPWPCEQRIESTG